MNTPQAAPATRRAPILLWLMLAAVALATTLFIVPRQFPQLAGHESSTLNQFAAKAQAWLVNFPASIKLKQADDDAAAGTSPADQVKMLDSAARTLVLEVDRSPHDPSLRNRLGLLYLSLGQYDDATKQFEQAVTLARSGLSVISVKINNAKHSGNTQQASAALLDASQLNVELSAAHTNLARVYEKRGEHEKVVAELELLNKEGNLMQQAASEAVVETPKSKIMNPDAAASLARAEAYSNARQWHLAAGEYRKVIALDPSVALAHHRLGTILAMSGNAPMAVGELESAAELDPASAKIQSDLGIAYQTINVIPQAIRSYERAVALDPRSVDAAINLSNIYSAQGRTSEAIAVLTQATRDNPKSAKAHNNLGTLYTLQSKHHLALAEFEKAITLAPTMASAHYGMGEAFMGMHSYMPAVQEFKQALTLSPNFSEAQLRMEEAYRKASTSVRNPD